MVCGSVADPDPNPVPDPPDPHVFGPFGSGSISQRYGSGSFYHHAKIVRKTLIPTIFDFLSLKNDVNVPSKSNKQKIKTKNLFFVGILKANDENSRIRIRDLDPDPLDRGRIQRKTWCVGPYAGFDYITSPYVPPPHITWETMLFTGLYDMLFVGLFVCL